MIEFVTLFLGLASGPQTVEVVVGESVAAVELVLDGETVARAEEPPWLLPLDLGPLPLPRRLAAVARGAGGEELGRAEQGINLPRDAAEARLLLERSAEGHPVAAQLTWESRAGARPAQVTVTLDGEPLAVADWDRFELPPVELDRFHVLQARLRFSDEVWAETYVGFGGAYTDTTDIRLTALPVTMVGKAASYGPRDLQDLLRKAGEPLRVVAVERGLADVVVVRAGAVVEAVARLEGLTGRDSSSAIGSINVVSVADAGPSVRGAYATTNDRIRRVAALAEDERLRLLVPRTKEVVRQVLRMELFPTSPEISPEQGGYRWALGLEVTLPGLEGGERLADAVAIAGLHAASGNRRRAVVLALAGEVEDASRYAVGEVRRYLEALRVPLVVWRIGEAVAADRRWGAVETIADEKDLKRAVRELQAGLDRQRMIWLEGRHLPAEISLPERRAGVLPVN